MHVLSISRLQESKPVDAENYVVFEDILLTGQVCIDTYLLQ